MCATADFREDFGRREPVGLGLQRGQFGPLDQAGGPNLEELVEIRAGDAQKVEPLQQRGPRILGLFEHAAIELEQTQFPIDVPLRIVEGAGENLTGRGRAPAGTGRHHLRQIRHRIALPDQMFSCANHALSFLPAETRDENQPFDGDIRQFFDRKDAMLGQACPRRLADALHVADDQTGSSKKQSIRIASGGSSETVGRLRRSHPDRSPACAESHHSNFRTGVSTSILLENAQVIAVAFRGHVLLRDETQGGRVHAVTFSGGFRTIVEDVPQMRVGMSATDFGPCHQE